MRLEKLFITQDCGVYTSEHHQVWQALCKRQTDALEEKACRQFYEGLHKINLDPESVPRLDDINERIAPITGWTAQAVPGYLD